jgi:hypothetical protein
MIRLPKLSQADPKLDAERPKNMLDFFGFSLIWKHVFLYKTKLFYSNCGVACDLLAQILPSFKVGENSYELSCWVSKKTLTSCHDDDDDFRLQQSRSNQRVVALRDLSLGSSGIYTCEASSEAPRFKTVSGTGTMQVIEI